MVDDLLAKVAQPNQSYRLDELGSPVVVALRQIPRDLIPDMPDRIVTATAKAANCALLTRDRVITASGLVPIIW